MGENNNGQKAAWNDYFLLSLRGKEKRIMAEESHLAPVDRRQAQR